MISILLIQLTLIESVDDCDNVGPCCFSCPMFDVCDHHYDEGDD